MGWERRGNRWYFYRTRRIGKHVRKIYLGKNPNALLVDPSDRQDLDKPSGHELATDALGMAVRMPQRIDIEGCGDYRAKPPG